MHDIYEVVGWVELFIEMADELEDQLDYEFHDSETGSEQETVEATPSELDKKAKKKAKDKERKRIKNEEDFKQKKTLSKLEPSYIADYISKKVTKSNSELSEIELAEKTVPESQIVFTGTFEDEATLENYGKFFSKFELNKRGKGKELVLVVTMSAIRVCNVVRALRSVNKGAALKLIKQNKPDYDRRCLRSPAHVAVSTPGRVEKLVELKILDLKRVTRVVVDSTFIDVKQRTVWDIDGTVELVSQLAHQGAKIYLY